MDRNGEWNLFLNNLQSCALKELQSTKEYEYLGKWQEEVDELLNNGLTEHEKNVVDGIIYEMGLAHKRETALLYQQGFVDCVWLLKNLGVLA